MARRKKLTLMMIRGLKSTKDFVCFLDSFFPQKVACKHSRWTMVAIYIYMCVCVSVHIYIYIYIYIQIYIYIRNALT